VETNGRELSVRLFLTLHEDGDAPVERERSATFSVVRRPRLSTAGSEPAWP
jgi:hypothetical protein